MKAETGVPAHRIDALTDGIFAFALTLLVLGIAVPAVPAGQQAEDALPGLLLELWPAVFAFAVAFMVLASTWQEHVRIFGRVVRLDRWLVRLLLIKLFGIVFVPFSTAFVAEYGWTRIAAWLFALNIGAIDLLTVAQVRHMARHPGLLVAPLSRAERRRELARSFAAPVAALVAVLVSFAVPGLSYLAYALIPIFEAAADHMWSR